MKKTPLVSIGLLTYNHENYIEQALNGLLCLDYADAEIVILDDASVDNTVNIVLSYIDSLKKKFVNVNCIFHKKNSGNISQNMNELIINTVGTYYWGIAGDDIILPNSAELLVKTIQGIPRCTVIHANMIIVPDSYQPNDRVDYSNTVIKNKQSGVENEGLFYELMLQNCIAAPTVLMNRSVFTNNGLHDETIPYEDYEYWLRISRREKFYYLNEPVVLYRRGMSSISNFYSSQGLKKLHKMIDIDYCVKEKYIHELTEKEQAICWTEYFNYYMKICSNLNDTEGKKLLEEKVKDKHINIYSREVDSKEIQDRQRKENILLETWDRMQNSAEYLEDLLSSEKIKSVAIYGYARLGKRLEKELEKTNISVKYIIDQKAPFLRSQRPIHTLEDKLEKVDAIIVTPINLYEKICFKIEAKCGAKILELEHLIEKTMVSSRAEIVEKR